LAVEGVFFDIVLVGDEVFCDEYLWGGGGVEVVSGVEEVAANEGGVEILGVRSAVFVGAVEGCSHLSFVGLFVEIDGASGGAFR
jgi:hypothetical protein